MKKTFIGLVLLLASIGLHCQNYLVFKYNGLYGLLDKRDMSIVEKPLYKSIEINNDSSYILRKTTDQGQIFCIKINGSTAMTSDKQIGFASTNVYFSEKPTTQYDLYSIKNGTFIGSVSKVVKSYDNLIPIKYADIGNKYFFINSKGKSSFAREIRKCHGFKDGYCVVEFQDFSFGIMDKKGNILCTFYQCSLDVKEGAVYAEDLDGRTGYFDVNGNLLYEIKIDRYDGALNATSLDSSVALVNTSFKDHQWSLISLEDGREIKLNGILSCSDFNEGYCLVILIKKNSHEYNFIDHSGKFLYPRNFENAESFYNGHAIVTLDGKDALIDTNGNLTYIEDIIN